VRYFGNELDAKLKLTAMIVEGMEVTIPASSAGSSSPVKHQDLSPADGRAGERPARHPQVRSLWEAPAYQGGCCKAKALDIIRRRARDEPLTGPTDPRRGVPTRRF